MIKTIVTPKNNNLNITVPNSYIGKKVEVIAFILEEPGDEIINSDNSLTYFASEKVLAKEWLTPEEDNAWISL